MRLYAFTAFAGGLLLAAGQVFGLPSYADDAKGSPRELIVGRWKLVDPEVNQTVEFAKDGSLKFTTTHLVVNGKKLPLGRKDGKPIEATLKGKYKFTGDGTIEGEVENPFRDSDGKKLPLRWTSVSVSKERLSFDAGEKDGGRMKNAYERVK